MLPNFCCSDRELPPTRQIPALYQALPILVFSTVTVNAYFILQKGFSNRVAQLQDWQKLVVAVALGCGTGFAFVFIAAFYRQRLDAYFAKHARGGIPQMPTKSRMGQFLGIFFRGVNINIYEAIMQHNAVQTIHENVEVYDPKTEEAFKYLQIFTAICDAFSHGANDVANAVAPFAGILTTYR